MKDDLRLALRSLRKEPGFVAVAILTLALGIGVNTSLFSLVSAIFLQPLSVKDPQDLVVVMQRGDLINVPYGHSYLDYLDFREGTTSFSQLAAYMPTPVHLSAPGQTPERTWIEVVSPNYFALAGVEAHLGQVLRPGEGEGKGAAPTIVLESSLLAAALRRRSVHDRQGHRAQREELHGARRDPRELLRLVLGDGGERVRPVRGHGHPLWKEARAFSRTEARTPSA